MTNRRNSILRSILLVALPMASFAGCAAEAQFDVADDKEDRWNAANDPNRMGRDYTINWEELNTDELQSGASEIVPWPDTYWPMTADGYNYRWQGSDTLSPIEAYDKAFNNWGPSDGIESFLALDKFSAPGVPYDVEYYEEYGPATRWSHVEGGNYRARVQTAPDGTPLWNDESEDEFADWGGLQDWFGHCHAWAPAAFSFPEPQHAVTHNGQTFEVADIKALAEATLEGGSSLFLGGRCNTDDVERDENGRIIDVECRDTNAGAFHIVTVNRLGIRKASFVVDVTYDSAVWNQPVRDYTIIDQHEVTEAEALELVGRTDVTEYPYSDAERFAFVDMSFRYVVEGDATKTPYLDKIDDFTTEVRYNYLLEMDANGDIIGGEWVNGTEQPDFLWAPYGGAHDIRDRSGELVIKVEDVKALVALSIE